jgi:hypothetical protein
VDLHREQERDDEEDPADEENDVHRSLLTLDRFVDTENVAVQVAHAD